MAVIAAGAFHCDRMRPLSLFDIGGGDHRLCPAFDIELLQNRRNVGLDRRLGDRELIGDLFIEQAFRQHHQHAHLLRGQRRKAAHQRAGLARGSKDRDRAASSARRRAPRARRPASSRHRAILGYSPKRQNPGNGASPPRSSLAETTITGTLACWARRYISPENPRTPGMARSSNTRSMSGVLSRAADRLSRSAASKNSAPWMAPLSACRSAPSTRGWSSAIRMRVFSFKASFLIPARRRFGRSAA